ncbi:PQQ-binding-like beta-propeller repeat protein [bacterium]|nr:PQQ-binding-like beta-propeller repeat protein [bacterium]
MTVLIFCASFSSWASAEDWPGWRGPRADGVSAESKLPTHWSPTDGIRWKSAIPGRGHSSPIVVGDAIFLLSADETAQDRLLLRIDRKTGQIVWTQIVIHAPLEPIHHLNTFASSTPLCDGTRVFVTFLDQDETYVAAYDFNGQQIWESRPGPFSSKHGFCLSPVLYKDWIIINGDHDGESFLAALDRATGKVVWRVPRVNKTRSYSVPRILSIQGRDQIILTGSLLTSGFDAQTGERIWWADGPSEQMVASIVEKGDLLFALGGYPERHLLAIRKGGSGNITDSHIVWRTHRGIPYVPSPLMYGDWLHIVSDDGMYSCYEPITGKLLSQKRVSSHVSGSIVGGDGHVYISDDEGKTIVLQNAGEFQITANNELGEGVFSSMAISQGNLFLRGEKHLFSIGQP